MHKIPLIKTADELLFHTLAISKLLVMQSLMIVHNHFSMFYHTQFQYTVFQLFMCIRF